VHILLVGKDNLLLNRFLSVATKSEEGLHPSFSNLFLCFDLRVCERECVRVSCTLIFQISLFYFLYHVINVIHFLFFFHLSLSYALSFLTTDSTGFLVDACQPPLDSGNVTRGVFVVFAVDAVGPVLVASEVVAGVATGNDEGHLAF